MNPGRQRLVLGLATLLLAVVAARAALPDLAKRQINARLQAMPGYSGEVADVDLALLRGAYALDEVVIHKLGASAPVPFVDLPRVDFALRWRAILGGSLVGEVKLFHPVVHFTNGPDLTDDQAGTGVDWREAVQGLLPLRIDRFAVYDGELHFADFSTSPPVDLEVRGLEIEARNLTNSEWSKRARFATIDASGAALGSGHLALHADLDPTAGTPTFALDVHLSRVDLAALDPFLSAYAGIDAEGGRVTLWSQVTCERGIVAGYVAPTLTDARVFSSKVGDEPELAHRSSAEELPQGGGVTPRIPIEGALRDRDPGGWTAVFSLLGSAYVGALFRSIDDHLATGEAAAPSAMAAEASVAEGSAPAERDLGSH